MVEQQNAELVRNLWRSINEHGPDVILDFCSDDYVRHEASKDYSREQFMFILAERLEAFPDSKTETLDLLVDGDKVAYRWKSEGTQVGEYRGIPPTGQVVRAGGLTITRIEDGKIVEEWALWNKSSVLNSLGINQPHTKPDFVADGDVEAAPAANSAS